MVLACWAAVNRRLICAYLGCLAELSGTLEHVPGVQPFTVSLAGEPNAELLRIQLHDPSRRVAKGVPVRSRESIQDTTEGQPVRVPLLVPRHSCGRGLSLWGTVDVALGKPRGQITARREGRCADDRPRGQSVASSRPVQRGAAVAQQQRHRLGWNTSLIASQHPWDRCLRRAEPAARSPQPSRQRPHGWRLLLAGLPQPPSGRCRAEDLRRQS